LRSLFRDIDKQDRTHALASIHATTPLEIQIASSQVDLMIAVARLQNAAQEKLHADPSMLQMAVVSDSLCTSMAEKVTGETAAVTATGADNTSWTTDYDMVRVNGIWKLSLAMNIQSAPPNTTPAQAQALIKILIQSTNDAADGVNSGQLKSIDDVSQKISEAIGKDTGGAP
jgi:hypothetical protein